MDLKIKVVYLKNNAYGPRVIEIDNSLKDMQKLVGGRIEHASSLCHGDSSIISKYDLWCNEESLLGDDIQPNIYIGSMPPERRRYNLDSFLFGDIFIAGSNDEGETISVSEEDIPSIMEELRKRLFQNKFRKSI